MTKKPLIPIVFYRTVLFVLSLLSILSAVQIRQTLVEKGILTSSVIWNGFTLLLFGFGLLLAGICTFLIFSRRDLIIFTGLEKKIGSFNKIGAILIILLNFLFYIFYYYLHPSFLEILNGFFFRALLLIINSLLIIIFLQNIYSKRELHDKVSLLFFIIPLVLVISQRLVVEISVINNIPFSLSWAESSHLYFTSAVFGKQLYGFPVPMYPYNQTRYIMQSLPFLIPGLPIWVHRAWQFILNYAVLAVFVLALQRRLQIQEKPARVLFFLFCFLWLSIIYIYYHLIVIAFFIVAFYSKENVKRNIAIIVLASVWAGFSRINWVPVPGLLAAFLYTLETAMDKKSSFLRYIQKPFLYAMIGGITGIIAQYVYISISGNNDASVHTAIFRSLLLWHRLLPNPTFYPGILPGILLMSGFMIFFIIKYFFIDRGIFLFRKILIALILTAFFTGGLIVSIKIGGGNNLHNMDAFIIFLLTMAGYVFFRHVNFDKKSLSVNVGKYLPIIMAGILITPILWSLAFPFQPNPSGMNEAGYRQVIAKMNEIIDEYAPNRKVLFISQRQLLTFNYLNNIQMIPDFEQELLMEMVMSGDRSRLDPFYKKLVNHEYEVIVSYPMTTLKFGYEMPYAEENNLWVSGVSSQIYLRYDTIALFPEYEIEMLIPKSK